MAEEVQNGTILIVDDVSTNVDVLASVLQRHGYHTLTADSGAEGLRLAREHVPELILLDINMPIMSGFQVCEALKADDTTAEIPVIFISALDDVDHVVKGFELGGVDYITKPFKFREVIARVQGQLTLFRQKRELEQLREKDRQHYQTLDQIRQEFIGSATHDLKNPLFTIAGYTELLEQLPELHNSPDAHTYLQAIRRGLEKMRSLVQNMLELLQLETNPTLNRGMHSFKEILIEQRLDWEMQASENDKTLHVELPSDDRLLNVDLARLARVLDNLVSNAIKYTDEGGEITVRGVLRENAVVFEVQDTGLGIPEEALPTLFEPFQRVNHLEHKKRDGTGLGLSIVKTIVDQHGGTIAVDSKFGIGSTFRVILPQRESGQ